MTQPLPPVQFLAILDRHIGYEPTKYQHCPGTETPHLFTFPVYHGRSAKGLSRSFSINVTDLKILIMKHGFLRMQSNDPGEITLYFGEIK